MSKFVRKVATAAAVVGSIALAAGSFGIGSVATAALLTKLGTAASVGGALLGSIAAKRPVNERQGQQLQFKIDPDGPIPFGMGRYATGGTLAHRETYGTDNSYQTSFVILGGGGPYAGVDTFTADRAAVALSGTSALGYYANWLWQDRQLGATPEVDALGSGVGAAPYGTAGPVPNWGPAHKLSGYAAASLTLLFDTKARRYAQGEPIPCWIMRGRLVYDPRLDSTYPGGSGPCRWADPADTAAHASARATWVYSTSPALHGLAWRLGIWQRDETNPAARYQKIGGIGAPIDLIDLAAIVHAANVQAANGWTIGGEVDSSQDKWEVLKLIEQTGGCEAIAVGAMMSTLIRSPRVSLRTITAADLADGPLRAPAMRSRSERINGYRARFRSEPHGWEMTSIDIVQVPDYVTADGRAKTGSGDFSLVTDPDQCAELAAYEVFDSREIEPITVSLKPFAVAYRLGDCLTLDLPDIGLQSRDVIVRGRSVDPATGIVTLTCRSETAAKHPAALGLTGATPPTPTLTADPDNIATPSAAAWSAAMGYAVSSGIQVPAILITGAVDNASADGILFEYRRGGANEWADTGIAPPDTSTKIIAPVEPGEIYEVGIRYRARGIYSARLTLQPGASGEVAVEWPVVTGPGRPQDNATVGAPIGTNVGGRTVVDLLEEVDVNTGTILSEALRQDDLLQVFDARSLVEGQGVATKFLTFRNDQTTTNEAVASDFALIGAKTADGTAWNLALDSVRVSPTKTLAQRFEEIGAVTDGATVSVQFLQDAFIGDGQTYAKAILRAEANGVFGAFSVTADGITRRSSITMVASELSLVSEVDGVPVVPFQVIGNTVIATNFQADIITYGALVQRFTDVGRQNLDPNGWYQELPGGVIMQGGRYRGFINSEVTFAVSFPRPFPTQVLAVGAMPFLNSYSNLRDLWLQNVGEPSLTGTTFATQAATSNAQKLDGFDWWAWGR